MKAKRIARVVFLGLCITVGAFADEISETLELYGHAFDMIWLILAYLLHTTGELCLSPVGLSAVTKLSIGRVVGVSMGTWFLATALSETVATRLGKMAALATEGGEVTDSAGALATYTQLFEFLMYVGVGVGVVVLLVSPILRRGMHGVH